jgi:hypothetical protein
MDSQGERKSYQVWTYVNMADYEVDIHGRIKSDCCWIPVKSLGTCTVLVFFRTESRKGDGPPFHFRAL